MQMIRHVKNYLWFRAVLLAGSEKLAGLKPSERPSSANRRGVSAENLVRRDAEHHTRDAYAPLTYRKPWPPSAVLENRFEDCSDILMSKPIKTKFDETFTLSCFLCAFAVP